MEPKVPSFSLGKDEKDHLVELLKRNHDIVLEKYELQKQRNDVLERTAVEKEKLYNEIKLENDQIANSNYKFQRSNEDLSNEKRIFETKVRALEQSLKQAQEDFRIMRVSHDKLDNQLKLTTEQLVMVEKSLEDFQVKKQMEVDLLSKEISSLTLKERDAKQKAYALERGLMEQSDMMRGFSQELDSRTRENEHLVSLLED